MKEFITQYWIEVIFGLICAAIAYITRQGTAKYKKLLEAEKIAKKNEFWDDVKNVIKQDHSDLEEKINQRTLESLDRYEKTCKQIEQTNENLSVLKQGMLSVQGKEFKEGCRALLDNNHDITLSEFEDISVEHNVYKHLGGNHDGDALFDLVKAKYEKSL